MAIAALVTALVGVVQIGLLRKQMRDDARPYIVADVVPGLHGDGSWDLVLHSTGRSTARNVTVATDPALMPDGLSADDHITEPLMEYLKGSRPLPPGARHRLMWRYSHKGEEDAGAPAQVTVTVTYDDDRQRSVRRLAGAAWQVLCRLLGRAGAEAAARGRYIEVFGFDTDALGPSTPVPAEGPYKCGSEQGQELMNIDRAIRNLAKHVGELRR